MALTAEIEQTRPSRSGRDYGLTGAGAADARAKGLVNAEWYRTEVPRKVLKDLMKRRDGPGIRDTAIWFSLLAVSASGGIALWGSWAAVPFWIVYGLMYGSVADSRWHETSHGTAFRSDWMNRVIYHLTSFMVVRNPVIWQWSHARHHTDTIITGRDPEISCKRPPNLLRLILSYAGVYDMFHSMRALAGHALGRIGEDEKDYTPETEWPRAILSARIHIAIHGTTLLATIWMLASGQGWAAAIPFLLVGGPRIYGCWHLLMTALIQHCGMSDNVVDHRLNTRTVYMNPVSRWIYWNMNYHVEHHMFPMVPYHALPKLHETIKYDLPAPNPSIWDAYREAVPAVLRQARDPDFVIRKPLPPTAQPYRDRPV
jgi:fatty acid desaturase